MTEQITTLEATWLSVTEFTQVAGLSQGDVVELVEVGVLKPLGRSVNDWSFDSESMNLARRLRRIREDLELNLDVHALALGFRLLERINELETALNRAQIQQLQDRT
ncbi:MAG: chaperone modulator CbpM [Fluviibacter sp.]